MTANQSTADSDVFITYASVLRLSAAGPGTPKFEILIGPVDHARLPDLPLSILVSPNELRPQSLDLKEHLVLMQTEDLTGKLPERWNSIDTLLVRSPLRLILPDRLEPLAQSALEHNRPAWFKLSKNNKKNNKSYKLRAIELTSGN